MYLKSKLPWLTPVVVKFLSGITTRVPPHHSFPKQITRHASRSLFRASLSHSRGHSSFREHSHPENSHAPSTFLSTSQPFPRQLFPLQVRHLQQSTSLIFTFNSASKTPLIRRVSYTARSSHVLTVKTTLAPAQIVTIGNMDHSQQSRA